jgi:hypothetical protein
MTESDVEIFVQFVFVFAMQTDYQITVYCFSCMIYRAVNEMRRK